MFGADAISVSDIDYSTKQYGRALFSFPWELRSCVGEKRVRRGHACQTFGIDLQKKKKMRESCLKLEGSDGQKMRPSQKDIPLDTGE